MKHSSVATGVVALFLAPLAMPLSSAEDLVPLTMVERVGFPRQGEWVTFGVPLPQGKVNKVEDLALIQGEKAIVADIIPVNRWWNDGSLRWVHALFRGDCPANGTATVKLVLGRASPPPSKPLKVTDRVDRYVVDTGALVFEVRKRSFNVIDRASVGGEPVITGHDRGLGVVVESAEYLAVLDAETEVILEESGDLHAVFRGTGSFRDAKGEKKLDFDARLYAYAGSSEVRVVVTVVNRQGRDSDHIPLDGLFLDLPTEVEQGHCLFGTESGGTVEGDLKESSEAYLYQSSSSTHVFGGAVSGKGGGKQTKPETIGWGDLADSRKGLAVGCPLVLATPSQVHRVLEGRKVRVGLYPPRRAAPLDVYAGVARTHEMRLYFHAGPAEGPRLHGVFAGLQRPLRPMAPPEWYCRETRSLGRYCEAGGSELYGPFTETVQRFDAAFELANRRCQEFRDHRTIKGVQTDSYGFLGFGDGVHHVWTAGVTVPENIAWSGNYYGYPHMMCVQFLRTGNREYFDNFEAHALHVADVHTVHHSERKQLVGGCRYCPPTDHVRIDPKNSSDYRSARVYVSNLFNHHKVAGVIDRWYFLRDHRSRDVAETVLDYCHRWTNGDNDFGQPRGPGMILDFCYQGYMLTGEAKWIRRAANVLRVHKGRKLKLSFQAGIFLEGMRRYYEMSGDGEALRYLQESADRLIDEGKKGGVTAQAHSFLYLETGGEKYLSAALENLPRSGRFGNPWKQYALSMRNAAMCIGDLHVAAQRLRD